MATEHRTNGQVRIFLYKTQIRLDEDQFSDDGLSKNIFDKGWKEKKASILTNNNSEKN